MGDLFSSKAEAGRRAPVRKKACNKIMKKPKHQKIRKLGYMEKRELEVLPQKIDALESEQKDLYEAMSDPFFIKREKRRSQRSKHVSIRLNMKSMRHTFAGKNLKAGLIIGRRPLFF